MKSWRKRIELIRGQIHIHRHTLISPLILGLLSLPRVILTFIFVCTKLDDNSIPSLIAFLISFLPSMAILFAFVWPSKLYRTAFFRSMRTILPERLHNVILSSRD